MQRSMQTVVAFFSGTRQRLPSGGASGQPATATTASTAYGLQEEDLGGLHRAAARGDLAWLRRWRWWLKRAGIDKRDKQKRTPLHLACANGHADVVRYLVRKNCQLNLADSFKRSPLMKAVECQQEKCVAILLEHGADPNLADADGNTALHLAVLSPNTTVAGLLLEHNASIDAQNQDGYTPLNLAISRHQEEMVEFLQKKGAAGRAQDPYESEVLVENLDGENMEEPHAGGAEDEVVLSSSFPMRTVDKAALAQDAGGAQPVGEVEQEHDAEFREGFEALPLRNTMVSPLQDLLLASLGTYSAINQLEEHVQCLEMENARLEATIQQQSSWIEALQRNLQASASVQKQNVLSLTSEALHSMLEEALQRRAHAKEHVDQRDREKAEPLEQRNSEAQQVFRVAEEICRPTGCVCRGLKINSKVEKDSERMEMQLHGAMRNGRVYEEREMESKINSEDKMKTNCSETASEGGGLRRKHCSQTKTENTTRRQRPRRRKKRAAAEPRTEAFMVGDLSQELEKESKERMQLEAENRGLREELSAMRENHENLEKSESQLKEELAKLKHHMETNMVDRSRTEQYKREVGDLSQKLEKESKERMQLEAENRDLWEELSAMHENWEELEKSKSQLKEELAKLKHHMETNMVDCSWIEQYKREVGDLSQKLEKESKECMELKADNRYLWEELSAMRENREELEKRKSQLKEEVAKLKHHMETNMVDRSWIEQYKREVGDLSQKLEKESKERTQLKAENRGLREELSAMRESHEKLEKRKSQLKEEVAKLKHHMETNMVDRSWIKQYKREVEEQATQKLRQKVEVSLILQKQAVSQDRLEQIRGSRHASLRNQLTHRIRDRECELDRIRNTQQDGIFQQEYLRAELESYKVLYLEEVEDVCRGNKLERADEMLAEANAKLLQERRRNRLPSTSSSDSEDLSESPVQYSTELGHLGNTLNASLCVERTVGSATRTSVPSINGAEAYM